VEDEWVGRRPSRKPGCPSTLLYNVVTKREAAGALVGADADLSTQLTGVENEEGQLALLGSGSGEALPPLGGWLLR